jgi:DNA helicase-2/ATP-dependent DNA helicase PcrA
MEKLYLTHARRRRVYGDFQFNPPSPFLAEIPLSLLDDQVGVKSSNSPKADRAPKAAAHNLAAVFAGMPGAEQSSAEDEKESFEEFEEDVRLVPEPDQGPRIGMRVRHVKFGVGTVRRLEGQGDNQKVTVYFNRVGPKKLLLKFAGLEPA